ncbi:hypothetical protein RJ641_010134 [Dillenia turbinata]|uniref:Uncharacterized protein n=1 Tax=Dillenia turbinata TaxID=194707 RepID=A0AAN8UZX5_9MAGN
MASQIQPPKFSFISPYQKEMSHKKAHTQGNVPFSWEDSPGVSKFIHHEVQKFQLHDLNLSSSLSPPSSDKCGSSEEASTKRIKIPPPPCAAQLPVRSSSTKGSLRRHEDDPFYVAYKACTKSTKSGKLLSGEGSKIVVSSLVRNMFAFSCKHSSDVRDESLIRLPRLPPLPREKN